MLPPNIPLLHKDYFELKAIKKHKSRQSSVPSFLPQSRTYISVCEGAPFQLPFQENSPYHWRQKLGSKLDLNRQT